MRFLQNKEATLIFLVPTDETPEEMIALTSALPPEASGTSPAAVTYDELDVIKNILYDRATDYRKLPGQQYSVSAPGVMAVKMSIYQAALENAA